jgi:hypothetical protein
VGKFYHFPEVAAFQMCDPGVSGCDLRHGAYVSGNNTAECDTGNGATSCLVGKFVHFIIEGAVTGPISAAPGPTEFIVVPVVN